MTHQLTLILVAAVGYALATVGLKLSATSPTIAATALITLGFLAAAMAEIMLLRGASLGTIYITILGLETLLVLGFAWWIGEGMSLRNLLAGAMVLGGILTLSV